MHDFIKMFKIKYENMTTINDVKNSNVIKNATHIDNTIENTLLEIEIETVHKQCKKLLKKYENIKTELINTEWKLFCKRKKNE